METYSVREANKHVLHWRDLSARLGFEPCMVWNSAAVVWLQFLTAVFARNDGIAMLDNPMRRQAHRGGLLMACKTRNPMIDLVVAVDETVWHNDAVICIHRDVVCRAGLPAVLSISDITVVSASVSQKVLGHA